MNEPINIAMAGVILALGCFTVALSKSPEAMESVARKMRARARAMRAARAAWSRAYYSSLCDDLTFDQNREFMRSVMDVESVETEAGK